MYDIVAKVDQEIQAIKNEVLRKRLEKMGLDFDEYMPGMRFNPLVCEKENEIERYYLADGTPEGKLVVTFVDEFAGFDEFEKGETTIKVRIRYY